MSVASEYEVSGSSMPGPSVLRIGTGKGEAPLEIMYGSPGLKKSFQTPHPLSRPAIVTQLSPHRIRPNAFNEIRNKMRSFHQRRADSARLTAGYIARKAFPLQPAQRRGGNIGRNLPNFTGQSRDN